MENTFLTTLQSSAFKDDILEVNGYAGELTVVMKAEKVKGFLRMLKEQYGFNYFGDLTASDHYTDEARFELSYHVVNLDNKQRIRVSCFLEEDALTTESVKDLYPAATWLEREAFDMIGIKFEGHDDLRRMFLPEDFKWHPLRKEFPLLGIPGSIPLPDKGEPKEYK